jgi:hypothetical protein
MVYTVPARCLRPRSALAYGGRVLVRPAAAVLGALALVLGGGLGPLAPAAAAPAAPPAAVRATGPVSSIVHDVGSTPYRIATVRLADGRTARLRWNPCQQITYRVNVAAVPAAGRNAALAQIRRAVRRLGAVTGLRLSYRGTTTAVPRKATVATQRSEILIAVTKASATDLGIGDGVIGFGGYRYWQWTTPMPSGRDVASAAIARGWVVLDVDALARMRQGFGPGMTAGNVIQHELAHVVGLGHVNDPRQLMADTLTRTSPDGYADGDRTGLGLVGRRAGCLTVPADLVTDLR